MRVVLHRVRSAQASWDGQALACIELGLVALVGFGRDDAPQAVERMAGKVANLRIFEQGESKFGRSLLELDGQALVISQFTLCADFSRGRRPGLHLAASPEQARSLFESFSAGLRAAGARVQATPFGSRSQLDARHWGPFTVVLDG